jgi:hypothetical protein
MRTRTHINIKDLSVRVFNGRVVAFYPHVLHKLRSEAAFPDST